MLEAGDQLVCLAAPFFHAEGTYDGTAASLTDEVHLRVPRADSQVGFHRVVVTLEDFTGTENDTVDEAGLFLKRRTALRRFNVYQEFSAPACGVRTGTTLHAKGRLIRALWTRHAYLPYQGRLVRLLFPAGPHRRAQPGGQHPPQRPDGSQGVGTIRVQAGLRRELPRSLRVGPHTLATPTRCGTT